MTAKKLDSVPGIIVMNVCIHLRDKRLKCSPEERDLGVLIVGKFSVSQQCILVARSISCVLGVLRIAQLISQKK